MRNLSGIKMLVLAGVVALLLIGVGGCDPGTIIFSADTSPTLPPHAEAAK